MRLLLISDTHGKLDIVNELAAGAQADAVIHAGDFGFHDDGSYERISEREIGLQILHCNQPRDEKARLMALPWPERIGLQDPAAAGLLQSYSAQGEFRCLLPVWGIKDRGRQRGLRNQWTTCTSLTACAAGARSALLYGSEGTFCWIEDDAPSRGAEVWTRFPVRRSLRADRSAGDWRTRIFVSHVSPGKEPFVELLGARTRADFTISGHMGPPTCMVWNPFAVYDVEESIARLQGGLTSVKDACLGVADQDVSGIEEAFSLIGRLTEETVFMGRRGKVPRWYRAMTHVNLPDAHAGYAF